MIRSVSLRGEETPSRSLSLSLSPSPPPSFHSNHADWHFVVQKLLLQWGGGRTGSDIAAGRRSGNRIWFFFPIMTSYKGLSASCDIWHFLSLDSEIIKDGKTKHSLIKNIRETDMKLHMGKKAVTGWYQDTEQRWGNISGWNVKQTTTKRQKKRQNKDRKETKNVHRNIKQDKVTIFNRLRR